MCDTTLNTQLFKFCLGGVYLWYTLMGPSKKGKVAVFSHNFIPLICNLWSAYTAMCKHDDSNKSLQQCIEYVSRVFRLNYCCVWWMASIQASLSHTFLFLWKSLFHSTAKKKKKIILTEENIWSKSQGNLVQNPLQTGTFPHRWELMVWIVDQDLESDTMQSQQKYFSRINFVFQSKTSVFILLCFICIACQSVLSLSFHVQQLQWET